jgi:hypothetical protein
MLPPRFSVVVPTRNRANTLTATLATVTMQAFDDYEVVVSDNCSTPETQQVVDAAKAANPRINYFRADKPLAMSDNWEFALSHTRGEFVLFLGDDDGLMPYSLVEADSLLRRHNAPILHATSVLYTWPCLAAPTGRNCLWAPVSRGQRNVSSLEAVAQTANWHAPYTSLPTLYRSAFVRRDLIDELRRRAGRVFVTAIPDVFTAFAFGLLVSDYLSVDVPMTVEGVSGASTGFASWQQVSNPQINDEFDRLNERAAFRSHSAVPKATPSAWIIPDNFYCATDAVGLPEKYSLLDRRRMVECIVGELWTDDLEQRRRAVDRIRHSIAGEKELLSWFDAQDVVHQAPAPRPSFPRPPMGLQGNRLVVAADRYGAVDVAGAAVLAADLLGYEAGGIQYGDFLLPADAGAGFAKMESNIQALEGEVMELRNEVSLRDEQLRLRDEQLRQAALRNLPSRLWRKMRRAVGRRAA